MSNNKRAAFDYVDLHWSRPVKVLNTASGCTVILSLKGIDPDELWKHSKRVHVFIHSAAEYDLFRRAWMKYLRKLETTEDFSLSHVITVHMQKVEGYEGIVNELLNITGMYCEWRAKNNHPMKPHQMLKFDFSKTFVSPMKEAMEMQPLPLEDGMIPPVETRAFWLTVYFTNGDYEAAMVALIDDMYYNHGIDFPKAFAARKSFTAAGTMIPLILHEGQDYFPLFVDKATDDGKGKKSDPAADEIVQALLKESMGDEDLKKVLDSHGTDVTTFINDFLENGEGKELFDMYKFVRGMSERNLSSRVRLPVQVIPD